MEDISATIKTQLSQEAAHPTFLDFGDILVQKALAAAEAAGIGEGQRRTMLSPAAGISEEKRAMMLANHTVAQTCVFTCSEPSKIPVVKATHDAKIFANGCGAPGLKVNADFPFEDCCHQHDICYSTCNKHKNQCDFEMISCLNTTCSIVAPNDECRHTAVTLYDDIQLQSQPCKDYLGAQQKACDCTATKRQEL